MTVGPDFAVWEGVYASFAEAPAIGPGFAGDIWRERSLQAARELAARLERNEPADYSLVQRNIVLPIVTAQLLTERERVSILDFGGGLGGAFMILMKAVPQAKSKVDFQIVESDGICRIGTEFFAGKHAPTFVSALPDDGRFDVVHTASTIQYIEDWRSLVARLAAYKPLLLVFSNVFAGDFPSYVTRQNYYGSRIPHWFLNVSEFIVEVERHGYRLASRTDCHVKTLDRHGPMPMDNFPPALRIPNSLHLMFGRCPEPGAG